MGRPILSIVVAMDERHVIGRNGALPWHLPEDLRYFRRITMGKPIVMGRRTHESIGRPLPGRRNIVVSRNAAYTAAGCAVVSRLEEALALAGGVGEVMIIGGASLYREALPAASRIYLTEVHASVQGDVHFPEIRREQWREVVRSYVPADDRNAYAHSFVVLERVR